MSEEVRPRISEWEFDVLAALKAAKDIPGKPGVSSFDAERGWFTVTQVSERNELKGPSIRPALTVLCEAGFAQSKPLDSSRYYRVTQRGLDLIETGFQPDDDRLVVNSGSWTGIIEPVQVSQVLAILSDMEDVCERITDNQERAQIFGLIRALEVLVNLPNPPRQGVVALLRDPAFANIIQVATFLAALLAAVKP